jgi:hypothetical protein
MTDDPKSAHPDWPPPAFFLAYWVAVAGWMVGNQIVIEFIGSHGGQQWLSELIERHPIWAYMSYLGATILLFFFSAPFMVLAEKRAIFLLPMFIVQMPFWAAMLVGIYRSIAFLWNVSSPVRAAVNDLFATYTTRAMLFFLIVVISIIFSFAAYSFRASKQIHYGVVELLFGVGSIVFSVYSVVVAPFLAASDPPKDTDLWQAIFGFLAGVYIIVRGLVNIEDGLKQEQPLTARMIYDRLITALQKKVLPWLSLLFRPIKVPDH